MRGLFFFLSFSFIAFHASSQPGFQSQFQLLMKDAESGMFKHRGSFKEVIATDSVFYSTINLAGTSNNSISVSGDVFSYTADVRDSMSGKQGKASVEELRDLLVNTLGPKYVLTPLKIESWNPAIYGWRLRNGGLTVSITLYKKSSSKSHFTVLGIDNIDFKK